MDYREILQKLIDGDHLGMSDMDGAVEQIMTGGWDDAKIAAFLVALRIKGETIEEIAGGAKVMRRHVLAVNGHADAVDLCGTGGDGAHTINVSTTAAFVVAGAGLKVAKHGNRALSSRSGSADVLQALGANISNDPTQVERLLNDVGFAFMFAPNYHPSMAHVAASRRSLGVRTMFNLLGPLTNPAGVKRQLVGVYDADWVEPLAYVLKFLGATHALVVHGDDGLDEVSISGGTRYARLTPDGIETGKLLPRDAGVETHAKTDIAGGDAATNATSLRAVVEGKGIAAHTDVAVLNAAATLWAVGQADTLARGAEVARAAIASGAAADKLNRYIELSKA